MLIHLFFASSFSVTGVTKSVSSFWNVASGYASQMFTEDDLPAGIPYIFLEYLPVNRIEYLLADI